MIQRFSVPIHKVAQLIPTCLEVQRVLDSERVRSICEYQRDRLKRTGSFLFLGEFIFGTDDTQSYTDITQANHLVVLDGQHRLEATRNLHFFQPDYMLSCALVRLSPQFTSADAFALINKSVPVPDYVIATIHDASRRKTLEDIGVLFRKAYKSFVSKSATPRRPNLNVDKFLDRMANSPILLENFTSASSLMRYVEWNNVRLSGADNRITDLAKRKANNKSVHPCYLTADPDYSWMSDGRLMREYNSNIMTIGSHEREDNNTTVQTHAKRPRIPASVRNVCWINAFGQAMEGVCLCCKTVRITKMDFHAGHVVPHSRGGLATPNNLRPICATCNTSMGDRLMHEYIDAHFPSSAM